LAFTVGFGRLLRRYAKWSKVGNDNGARLALYGGQLNRKAFRLNAVHFTGW